MMVIKMNEEKVYSKKQGYEKRIEVLNNEIEINKKKIIRNSNKESITTITCAILTCIALYFFVPVLVSFFQADKATKSFLAVFGSVYIFWAFAMVAVAVICVYKAIKEASKTKKDNEQLNAKIQELEKEIESIEKEMSE